MITKIARYTAISALFVIPFIPLYVADGFFFPFISGKGFAFRILVEIAVGGYVVLALMDKKYRPRVSWTMITFGGFVLWMFIADFFGANPHKAFWSNYERMDGWVTLIHVFLFFMVTGALLTVDKLWKRWWLTMLGVTTLVCGYSLLQLGHVSGFPIHQGGVRVDATFGNAIYLAAYLLFMLAITLWQAIERKGWQRYALLILAVAEAFILFATATRGALLGVIFAAVVGSILWAIDSGKRGRQAAIALIVGIVVIAGGFFALKGTGFVQNDPTLRRLASISFSELETRFTLWGMALEGVAERPLTGWGQEGYNFVFNKYYKPSLYAQEAWFDRAHNTYIDWLVAGGIPALLLLLAILGSGAVALYRRKDVSKAERIFFLAALAGYSFQALVEFDNLISYICIAALLAIAHSASARTSKFFSGPKEVPASQASLVASGVVIVTLAVFFFVNVPGIQGSAKLINALNTANSSPVPKTIDAFKEALSSGSFATQEIREQIITYAASVVTATSVSAEDKTAVAQFAANEIGNEILASPLDARLQFQFALLARTFGDYTTALTQIDAALSNSPKKQGIMFEKGIELWQTQKYAEARTLLEAAYEEEPRYEEAVVYVAAARILDGHTADGQALLSEKFGTTAVDHPALLFAYYATNQFNELIALRKAKVTKENGSASSRYALASAYVVAKRIPEAIAEIRATIAAHPESADTGNQMLTQLGVK